MCFFPQKVCLWEIIRKDVVRIDTNYPSIMQNKRQMEKQTWNRQLYYSNFSCNVRILCFVLAEIQFTSSSICYLITIQVRDGRGEDNGDQNYLQPSAK